MLKQHDRSFKIIIAGSQGVGKSSLLHRYVDNQWSGNLLSTIGVDFKFKTTQVNGQKVKLQIWDTAGSQTFKSIVSAYYRGSDAVILVYDHSDVNSFRDLKGFWIGEVNKYKEDNCEMVLLANKADLPDSNLRNEEVKNFCEQENIGIYKMVSAKTGEGVAQAFQELVKRMLNKSLQKGKDGKKGQFLKMGVQQPTAQGTNKKCCG